MSKHSNKPTKSLEMTKKKRIIWLGFIHLCIHQMFKLLIPAGYLSHRCNKERKVPLEEMALEIGFEIWVGYVRGWFCHRRGRRELLAAQMCFKIHKEPLWCKQQRPQIVIKFSEFIGPCGERSLMWGPGIFLNLVRNRILNVDSKNRFYN